MTKVYKQLTLEQRYKIAAYINAGKNQTEIANILGVNKSTISRELNRNIPKRGVGAKIYVAKNAHVKACKRRSEKYKYTKFTLPLKLQMLKWMDEKRYSPECVHAEWSKQGISGVSHECIYQFIWHCKRTNERKNSKFKSAYKLLKHGKRRRKRGNYRDTRGLIPNRVSIENRPAVVEHRKRFGDVEVDLVMGKNHKSALLVTVERSTLHTTIDKLKGKNADVITHKIIKRMRQLPKIKTMTFDNDQAFTHHQKIAKALQIDTYFTRPYTSQDKGTIENRNGVIRLFFPKKTDFNLIEHKEIRRVEKEINNRPVRKFGYLSSNEVFLQRR
jgi:transposase, IS30 family